MVALAGFFAEETVYGYSAVDLTGDLDDYTDAWIGNRVYWDGWRSVVGQYVSAFPVSTAPRAISGLVAVSYFDDYYNRIHITPRAIDIGNLLSVQSRDVSVWNAWTTPQLLSSIGESETLGLTESGVAAPTTFAPLQESVFTVTVDTAGPVTIGAEYTFVFPSESPTLTVTGNRVQVFGFSPNWAESPTEKLSWLTDVMLAEGGIEQRAGLRDAPRRVLTYSLDTLDRHQTNVLETIMLGWQSRVWALPVWTERQDLTATLPAGSSTITCETDGYEFIADSLAILWRDYDSFEAVEVASVGAGSLTLTLPTVSEWPAGTRIYPVRLARMAARQKVERHTNYHVGGSFEFSITDNPAVTATDSGDVFGAYRVYGGHNNWAEPIETEFVRQLETIDYDTGIAPWVDDLSGMAAMLKSWNWLFVSRAEVVAFRQWLQARAGRLNPFWSISQAVDMEVVAPIGAASAEITIRNIGYHRQVAARADRRHVAIKTKTGAYYYRTITGTEEISATEEKLAIDSSLGVLLNVDDIESTRFLDLVRLETDDIEIQWHTLGVAEAKAMLRSLPQ